MTDETTTESPTATDAWTAQFADLKKRFPKVREAILVALHILMQDPDVSIEDAKARAAMHGVRITAASMNGARRLLDNQGGADDAQDAPVAAKPERKAPKRPARPAPRATATDAETLIRTVVGKLTVQASVEADRLRAAMRKAIEVLQAAVGDES